MSVLPRMKEVGDSLRGNSGLVWGKRCKDPLRQRLEEASIGH